MIVPYWVALSVTLVRGVSDGSLNWSIAKRIFRDEFPFGVLADDTRMCRLDASGEYVAVIDDG